MRTPVLFFSFLFFINILLWKAFPIDLPTQVARVLHLLYRLVAQPNTSRAHTFADSFISCGGIETLLVLLQREAKAGNQFISDNAIVNGANVSVQVSGLPICRDQAGRELEPISRRESTFHKEGSQLQSFDSVDKGKIPSSENALLKKVGGISFSLTADCARNDVYNVDNGDGIVVGIINLLGALVRSGQLKFSSNSESSLLHSSFLGNGLHDDGSTMFSDRVSLLFFALQKAFQAASQRLMTGNVYMAFMGATVCLGSILICFFFPCLKYLSLWHIFCTVLNRQVQPAYNAPLLLFSQWFHMFSCTNPYLQ